MPERIKDILAGLHRPWRRRQLPNSSPGLHDQAPSQSNLSNYAKSFLDSLDLDEEPLQLLISVFQDLHKCIELVDQNSHAQQRVAFSELVKGINGLLQRIRAYLTTPLSLTITASSYTRLICGIGQETVALLGVDRAVDASSGTWTKADTVQAIEYLRSILALMARFVMSESPEMWSTEDSRTDVTVEDLPHLPAALYSSTESRSLGRSGCAPSTRVQTLEKLRRWVYCPRDSGVHWLIGSLGVGKTTIAYSMCEYLESSGLLAASFFCSRRVLGCSNARRIAPSISYQLAQYSRPFRWAVSDVLSRCPQILQEPPVEQTHALVLAPLRKVAHTLPVSAIIVIDGIDALDDQDLAIRLFTVLGQVASVCPVRLLLTVRTGGMAVKMNNLRILGGCTSELCLDTLGPAVVRSDVRSYLVAQLRHVDDCESDFDKLTETVGMSLGQASTVAQLTESFGLAETINRLAPCVTNDVRITDVLHSMMLEYMMHVICGISIHIDDLESAMGMIVCLYEPTSVVTFVDLFRYCYGDTAAEACTSFIRITAHVHSSRQVVSYPPGFVDYMHGNWQTNKLCMSPVRYHAQLAQACFDAMKRLQGPLEVTRRQSSYAYNRDLANPDYEVHKEVPGAALYACRHWADHLHQSEPSEMLMQELHQWLSERLLVWIEVLCMTKVLAEGCQMLNGLWSWIQAQPDHDETKCLIQDAIKFSASYSQSPASRSTAHLYLSWLWLWPESLPVGECYKDWHTSWTQTAGQLSHRHQEAILGRLQNSIQWLEQKDQQYYGLHIHGHKAGTESITYSPDGACIASGAYDHAIYIWGANTHQQVGQALEGHTSGVNSVAYSPDGGRIASSSIDFTIRVWDAQTGQQSGQTLRGHTSLVKSVSWSPDGRHIVSGSADFMVRVWDTQTGRQIGRPRKGHTGWVNSVAYSPDGRHVVSGSGDHTVRVWDVQAGQQGVQKFEGHTGWVDSVSYSPDGRQIVSGSDDCTICIWDPNTSWLVGKIIEGHTSRVKSVAYSPDGRYIVSGSDDCTIRVWDAQTGQKTGRTFRGHTHRVNSVAYSPDGRYIASGSGDCTVRVWDAHTGRQVGQTLKGHRNQVHSIAYSPDGRYIVSGSADGVVRILDLTKVHQVQPPDAIQVLVNNPSFSELSWGSDGWIRNEHQQPLVYVDPSSKISEYAGIIGRRTLQLDLRGVNFGNGWFTGGQPNTTGS